MVKVVTVMGSVSQARRQVERSLSPGNWRHLDHRASLWSFVSTVWVRAPWEDCTKTAGLKGPSNNQCCYIMERIVECSGRWVKTEKQN